MIIKHRLLKAGEKPSEIKLIGSILNINRVDYDLDNVDSLETAEQVNENRPEKLVYVMGLVGGPTEEEVKARDAEIIEYNRLHSCYLENGEKTMMVIVDGPANEDHPEYQDRQFFFINNNALNLFDLNSNGIIEEGAELERFVEIWNTSYDNRREYLKKRLKK